MSGELIAILAVGAASLGVMLGALVPIRLSINGRLQTLGDRLQTLGERVADIRSIGAVKLGVDR